MEDLHRMSRDSILETEAYNNHLAFSQTLLADHYKCTKSTEHNLINWFTGIPPPSTPGAGTSTAIPGSVMDMTTSSSMYSQQ